MSLRASIHLRPLERAASAPHALIARLRSAGDELRPLAGDLEAHALLLGGALGDFAAEVGASDSLRDALARLALVPPAEIERAREERRARAGASALRESQAPSAESRSVSTASSQTAVRRGGSSAAPDGPAARRGGAPRETPREREHPLAGAVRAAELPGSATTLRRTAPETRPVDVARAHAGAAPSAVSRDLSVPGEHERHSLRTPDSTPDLELSSVAARGRALSMDPSAAAGSAHPITRESAARDLRARAELAGLAAAGLDRSLSQSVEGGAAIDAHAAIRTAAAAGIAPAPREPARTAEATVSPHAVSRSAPATSRAESHRETGDVPHAHVASAPGLLPASADSRLHEHGAVFATRAAQRRAVAQLLSGGIPSERALCAALGVSTDSRSSVREGAPSRHISSSLSVALERVEESVRKVERRRAEKAAQTQSGTSGGSTRPDELDPATALMASAAGVSGLRRLALRASAAIQRPGPEPRERVPETSVSAARAFASASSPLAASATPPSLLSDDDALAERLAAILAREARRHGIDPGDDA